MKFIHTSDLHLGKQLCGYNLIEDQKHILSRICSVAEENNVDGVIVAGDVYNKSSPSPEAMTLFSDFVSFFSKRNIPMYIISGNHDSAERVSYFSSLIRDSGIYVTEKFTGSLQKITVNDRFGAVDIYMLPFIRPSSVRNIFPDKKINSYEDAVRAVLENSEVDTSVRSIIVCHQLITNSQTGGSEELSIGGLENIPASLFDDFDYVAMGHIHRRQQSGREAVRYCGAPLKYASDEAAQQKSVTLVDMNEKGNVKISEIPLEPLHDVVSVKGKFPDLMMRDRTEDYVSVTVTDEDIRPDARISLRMVYPNMINFAVENSKTKESVKLSKMEKPEKMKPIDVFRDFFVSRNGDVEPTEKQMKIMEKIFSELEEDAE